MFFLSQTELGQNTEL